MDTALHEIAAKLAPPGKGILAADESTNTIKKRLESVGIEDTVENHRRYRELLFTTPGVEEYISGIILYDETIRQSTASGVPFVELLENLGIIPGIKVDHGKEPLEGSEKEYVTKGMFGLSERLSEYYSMGARFAKWRSLFVIGEGLPSDAAINKNTDLLASYALACQENSIVPIVEPEVLMEGNHSMKDSVQANYRVLKKLFLELSQKGVDLKGTILKASWAHSGKKSDKPTDEEVAESTYKILSEVVPQEIAGIVFLSGGDSPEDATGHLNALNKLRSPLDWPLSFSFGRALQEPVLQKWKGLDENKQAAQKEFLKRAKLDSLATFGEYDDEMEEVS